jgi:hypothetical protein
MDLLTTLTHDFELQVITALSLISTVHISPQQLLSLFPAWYVFTNRSLATASNSGDFSASHAQVLSSQQPPVQYSVSTDNWLDRPNCLQITLPHRWRRKRRSFSYANRFRTNMFALPSNGLRNPATGLHAITCRNWGSLRSDFCLMAHKTV